MTLVGRAMSLSYKDPVFVIKNIYMDEIARLVLIFEIIRFSIRRCVNGCDV